MCMPVCCSCAFADPSTLPATTWAFDDGQLLGQADFDHCADMNGAPLTRTPPRRSWGRGPPPPGWRRIQARRLTCPLLRAMQRRRVESQVLGALSSSPVHRALVLVLGDQHSGIVRLLSVRSVSRPLGLKSAKDLSFGRREGFLARYERANALPRRPRVGRPRGCPFFPVAAALAAVAPPKGRQLGAKCPHEGRRRVRTPSFSRTRPPKGDLCGTWSVHA